MSSDPAAEWARSGAMALSGRADGPPLLAPGFPATYAAGRLAAYATASAARTGRDPLTATHAPDLRVLGERAALAGLSRQGPRSCGGAFMAVPTADGWLGLSLARPDDFALVPALTSSQPGGDPWSTVAAWARLSSTDDALARAHLLGLPAAAWPPRHSHRSGVVVTTAGRRRGSDGDPLVVDLSALWAGPLCTHLLALAGCRVVKVESSRRLDGARRGTPAFYDLLHAGHDSVVLDFTEPEDVRRLRDLLGRADLVVESSRPRALASLGIDAHELVGDGVCWVSITARGRDSGTVGFGDDVAVAAGLAVEDGPDLLPLGDALADPLTGLAAAAAAAEALTQDSALLVDVSMLDVAREAGGATPSALVSQRGESWWVETETSVHPVMAPHAREPWASAAVPGTHNERWLR